MGWTIWTIWTDWTVWTDWTDWTGWTIWRGWRGWTWRTRVGVLAHAALIYMIIDQKKNHAWSMVTKRDGSRGNLNSFTR